jgi:hypothetical protein
LIEGIAKTGELDEQTIETRAQALLDSLAPAVRADVEGKMQQLKWHESNGCLSPDMYLGKRILDWEAGLGGFTAAFYCLGASEVVAIDSWVEASAISSELRQVPALGFEKIPAVDYAARQGQAGPKFDLIFSNTVTEHIADLPVALDALKSLLDDDGWYLNIHDNYYSPCGSHDHGFWFYGDAGRIDYQGVDCWARDEKCESSAAHRQKLLDSLPWTWNEDLERQRNPERCSECPYARRSQPWAHLRFVDDFCRVFEDRSFFTQREGSSLNKLTTFQIRQLLGEAGFKVVQFHRNRCSNTPSPELLDSGFSTLELTTTTSVWLCANQRDSDR